MNLHTPAILILLSGIIILSYLYSFLSKKFNIPSVILLITTGIIIRQISQAYGVEELNVNRPVMLLGAVGLIMIVLEAALDLKINKKKFQLIRDSFLSALFIFLLSSFSISIAISYFLTVHLFDAYLYAIPLSIISSAIVIPSTTHFNELKREFVVYESSFSDIIGILIFNFMLLDDLFSLAGMAVISISLVMVVVLSVFTTFLLMLIIMKIGIGVKFFLIFSVLCLLYGLGELIHLPSLLVVLVFGLVINNYQIIPLGKFSNLIKARTLTPVLDTIKLLTDETSFLIRTFFFILFGYSVDISVLFNVEVLKIGSLIMLILLAVRYFYIRVILGTKVFPLLFLMPRGLVTIILFYSIPAASSIGSFNEGVLFFVVTVSSLLMMIGILFHRDKQQEYYQKNEEVI